MNQLKLCKLCNKEKSIDLFGKNRRIPSGIHFYCKQCIKEKRQKQIEKNPDYFKKLEIAYQEKKAQKHKEKHANLENEKFIQNFFNDKFDKWKDLRMSIKDIHLILGFCLKRLK